MDQSNMSGFGGDASLAPAVPEGWASGAEGLLGFWTTPVEIVTSAVCGFVLTAIASIILQKIPKIGKYIIG